MQHCRTLFTNEGVDVIGITSTGPRVIERLADGWQPSPAGRFDIEPLAPVLGAEVTGLDLREGLAPEDRRVLWRLLLDWKLLVFRDQHLTAAQHVAVATALGTAFDDQVTSSRTDDPMANYVQFTRAADQPGLDNVWHADGSFRERPPVALTLQALEVPSLGGDTLFADMGVAYDNLPGELRDALESVRAVHDWSVGLYARAGTYGERRSEIARSLPPVEHPVVRRHPVTGRPTLYVNAAFTRSLSGSDAGGEMLDALVRQAAIPEYQYRLHWRPGTFVMFDNQALQHYAANDYLPSRRVMGRVTVAEWHPDLVPGEVAAAR